MNEEKEWHEAEEMPEPGKPLLIRLDCGDVVNGVMPNYEGSNCYHDMKGNQLHNVKLWAIK